MAMTDVLALLGDQATLARRPAFTIERADDTATIGEYRALRRRVFVGEQGLFERDDRDDTDDDPRAIVLVARLRSGTVSGGTVSGGAVVGGVRVAPADPGKPDVGWWRGSRLAVVREFRKQGDCPGSGSIGSALVRAACATAEEAGVLRFEATVQAGNERLFSRLGWVSVRPVTMAGADHVLMRWPVNRIAAQAASAKASLGPLLRGLADVPGFTGDDGVPVPGSDLVAACDAIVPSMVERDPEWAGWCSVLVNVNDLAAMGARPAGLLDALAARDASFAARVLSGIRKASAAYGVPVLGGHTQLGVPAALSVTALGQTSRPVPGGGGRPGHEIRVTADLGGGWRRGYTGRQWDSTTHRSPAQLRAMLGWVAAARPAAAKDASMAGIAGTLGMLAEASGCGAVLDVARVPRPAGATAGDWLTCFPGFGMITADAPGTAVPPAGPTISAVCGELMTGAGVRLRWPDGEETQVIDGAVTGLGRATPATGQGGSS
jgi:putative N-acetyltransferase (TIGR04045 family)